MKKYNNALAYFVIVMGSIIIGGYKTGAIEVITLNGFLWMLFSLGDMRGDK